MDKNGMLGEAIEQGQSTVKNIAKQTVKDFAKAAMGQISGSDKGTNETNNQTKPGMSDDQAKQFLKDLYGTENKPQPESPEKAPEDSAKLQKLRQELHQEVYYQPLVNPPKLQEERPAEKVENEKKKEGIELIEKEKGKPQPLPATAKQGTGEKLLGVSG